MSGCVFLDGQRADKPGQQVSPDAEPEVRSHELPFVSRGGYKLDKAIRVFGIDPTGKTCIDCGASTGGFTDVLLQHGAAKVYAVDVGYGQLAWKLREDPRVICLNAPTSVMSRRSRFRKSLIWPSVMSPLFPCVSSCRLWQSF